MLANRRHSRRLSPRRGVVVVLIAVCLVVILAFVAIAVDGGGLLELRRAAQATADAAALAAAEEVAALVGLAEKPVTAPMLLAAVTQDVADRVFFDVAPLQEMTDLLEEKRQLVFYGPPGTG